ncbi:hypothetical protein E2C01_055405 [Portunus trituberculatus]|uniref:Uncharacterized protein n=1 Tax=Portunus trituberculatus TaxID=210409 RepID=A0A5B7GV72_PORTR|nr:hypothetical protein [Portunus trituberculatus]
MQETYPRKATILSLMIYASLLELAPMARGWWVCLFLAPFCMNKAPTKKRRVEVISEEHIFTTSPMDSQDACLTAGQPKETIIHVKKVKLLVGEAEKLCLPATADRMASSDLTRQRVNPRTLHPYGLTTLVSRIAGHHGY